MKKLIFLISFFGLGLPIQAADNNNNNNDNNVDDIFLQEQPEQDELNRIRNDFLQRTSVLPSAFILPLRTQEEVPEQLAIVQLPRAVTSIGNDFLQTQQAQDDDDGMNEVASALPLTPEPLAIVLLPRAVTQIGNDFLQIADQLQQRNPQEYVSTVEEHARAIDRLKQIEDEFSTKDDDSIQR